MNGLVGGPLLVGARTPWAPLNPTLFSLLPSPAENCIRRQVLIVEVWVQVGHAG